jgi:uncharacterized protein DUF6580
MTPIRSTPRKGFPIPNIRPAMWTDWPLIACLIGLDVAARILPHAPDFTPVAATALFAACVLRFRLLSILVPIAAMLIGDAVLGFYDLKVMMIVYGSLALPACAACLSSSLRRPVVTVPMLAASSPIFFLLTNLAVWAFTPMYAATAAGLIKCYVAALPFLQNMLAGDLFWGFALFGPYWLCRMMRAPRAAIAA